MPTLAGIGSQDLQVSRATNLKAMAAALEGWEMYGESGSLNVTGKKCLVTSTARASVQSIGTAMADERIVASLSLHDVLAVSANQEFDRPGTRDRHDLATVVAIHDHFRTAPQAGTPNRRSSLG